MNKEQLDELMHVIDNMNERLDNPITKKLQLEKTGHAAEKLFIYGKECEDCRQQFTLLEDQLMQLNNQGNIIEELDINKHRKQVKEILSHLEKKHKVISEGYYLSICMSIGLGPGMIFGLTVFDNIALGMSFGLCIGVAVGVALDANAKKKGLVI
ncbi:hypothetical protein [Halalkalibacter okhensis]|uniref:Glycine zipper-like domain-containing protein n=1 Tax=Halalkalibacter okhensis TaxID=333138 RepID=A0A0B0IBC6_9BACI|nr:hypothetical protein [Halalkalibacter okhensis]KHF38172.1 hypothetical protein LQ50_22965 [Halalkalibacter okhensis]